MLHVEVRQFPHVARAFNLTAEQLHTRIVGRWVRDEMIDLDDRRWAPERAKLKIYEAPRLDSSELGLGRGWSNVTRTGEDVTERLLGAARTEAGLTADGARGSADALKQRLAAELARGPIELGQVPALAAERALGMRASEALAIAEQTVWEMLHHRGAILRDSAGPIESERWQAVVLDWRSWAAAGGVILLAARD